MLYCLIRFLCLWIKGGLEGEGILGRFKVGFIFVTLEKGRIKYILFIILVERVDVGSRI